MYWLECTHNKPLVLDDISSELLVGMYTVFIEMFANGNAPITPLFPCCHLAEK